MDVDVSLRAKIAHTDARLCRDTRGRYGGIAWAKIDTSEFLSGRVINASLQESNTRSGWTVGGGLEYTLGYGWSAKSEFLYVKFDNFTTFTSGPFSTNILSPREVKLEDYIWRAGLNYKFW